MGVSVSDSGLEQGQGLSKKEVKQKERKMLMKRRAVILSITTIFLVTAAILVTAVVHEELQRQHIGYSQFFCTEGDVKCWQMMCPQGMAPVKENNTCLAIPGHTQFIYVLCAF